MIVEMTPLAGPVPRGQRHVLVRRARSCPSCVPSDAHQLELVLPTEVQSHFDLATLAVGREGGLRTAIVRVLGARALPLSAVGRARLASCSEVATLTRWLERSATAASEADVFASDSAFSRTRRFRQAK